MSAAEPLAVPFSGFMNTGEARALELAGRATFLPNHHRRRGAGHAPVERESRQLLAAVGRSGRDADTRKTGGPWLREQNVPVVGCPKARRPL